MAYAQELLRSRKIQSTLTGRYLFMNDDGSFWRTQIDSIVKEPKILRFMFIGERADVYFSHLRRWELKHIIFKSLAVRDTLVLSRIMLSGRKSPSDLFIFDLPISGRVCITPDWQDEIPKYV